MNIIFQLYDFLTGTCFYFTVSLCIIGLVRKTIIIISGRRHGLRFPAIQAREYVPAGFEADESLLMPVTIAGRDPVLAVVSLVFHISIFAAPLTAVAHMILFDLAWHIMPPPVNPAVTGVFTWTAIITGLYLLARRTFKQNVLAVSSWKDYAAMTCVLTPFVTGLFAREFIGYYEIIIIIHCLSAHALLLAVGWTRLGHMVFFTAGRFTNPDMSVVNQV